MAAGQLAGKSQIREKYLSRRNELTMSEILEKSNRITERLLALPEVMDAEHVLIYCNYRSEVSTRKLIRYFLEETQKKVYLPRVILNDIAFYRIESMLELSYGYQGILEPLEKGDDALFTEETAKERCVDLVPGAVFDLSRGRMGYGKGFYDRFLAKFPEIPAVGLAFDVQVAKQPIPREAHDIVMNYVVTETRVIES